MKVTKIVIIGLLLLILFQVTFPRVSGFRELTTETSRGEPSGLFKLKSDLGCTASGFNPKSSYYSQDLTPGGLCGDGDFVRNQERDFKITGGIGGSLLA